MLSSSFRHGEQEISYHEIHRRFSKTEGGKVLANQVRYGGYKPPDMSGQEWIEILGPDVCNLGHLLHTYGMTRTFVGQCLKQGHALSVHDQEDLFLTAISHDWAEDIHGDKQWDLKTAAEGKAEMETLLSTSIEWLDGDFPGLSGRIGKALRRALDEGGDEKLLAMFNSVERIGYIRTALRAAYRSREFAEGSETCERLQALASSVLGNHLEEMTHRAEQCPGTAAFLHRCSQQFSTVLQELPDMPSVIQHRYKIKQADHVDERLQTAREAWECYAERIEVDQGVLLRA